MAPFAALWRRKKAGEFPAFPRVYTALLAFTLLLVLAGVGLLVRAQYRGALDEWKGRLVGTADGQEHYVPSWLNERRAGTEALASRLTPSAALAAGVPVERPAAPTGIVRRLFDRMTRFYKYFAIYYVTPAGVVCCRSTGAAPLPPGLVAAANRAPDLWIEVLPDSEARALRAAIVFAHTAEEGGSRLGTVLILVRATELSPLPPLGFAATRTGESFLVRPEGREAAFLSTPRLASGHSLRLASLSRRTVLEKKSVSGEQFDYRRRRTLVETRFLPESGWGLVTKIDRSEVLEHFTRLAALEIGGAIAIGLTLAAAIWIASRHRQMRQLRLEIERRTEVETELQSSRTMLAHILDSIPQSVVWKNRDGVYAGYNQAFVRSAGLEHLDRIVGKNDFDLWPHALAEHYRADDREVMENNRPKRHIVETLRKSDGSLRWVETTKLPLADGSGRIHGVLCVYEDITERKRAEEALRESQERLTLTLASSRTGLWDLDLVSDRSWRSVEHDRIFGYESPVPEWGRQIFLDHVLPEDREYVEARFEDAYRHGRLWFECRIRRAGQDVRWIAAAGNTFYDGSGTPVRMMGAVSDVTDRKESEEALRASEAELKSAQRVAHLGTWNLDTATGRVVWSEELYRMLGLDPRLPPPDYPEHHRLFRPESWTRLSGALQQTVETGIPYELELEMVRADGTTGWMLARGEAVRDAGGAITGLRGVALDITGRKEAEDRLRRTAAELKEAQRVAHLGAWRHDTATGQVVWSEEMYRMLDLDPRSPPPKFGDHHRLFAPESWALLKKAVERTTDTGIPYEIELETVRAEGATGWVLARGEAVRDADGAICGIQGVSLDITGRKRAEEELRRLNAKLEERVRQRTTQLQESEERLALALAASHDGVWDWNLETGAVWYSARWKAMLGYSESEVEPHAGAWERLLHPDDRARVREALETSLRGEKEYNIEFRLKHKDGHWVDILARGAVIRRGPHGPAIRSVGTHFDLTERKRAEEALREKEARLRLALDAARMAAWDWDVPGGGFVWNDEHFRMLGYRPGEVQPGFQAWVDRIHPEDRAANEAALRQSMERGEEYVAEFRTLWPDGAVRWIEARGRFGRDPAGRPVRNYGVMLDVTERKRAEVALRESQERLALVIQAARLGTWERDLVGAAFVWSPACLALFGLPPDTRMTFERFLEAVHPDDRERVARAGRETVEQHKDYDVEMRTVWPDGSLHWVASRGHAHYDESGRPLRLSGVAMDITARKRAEEALRQSEERYRTLAGAIPELIWTCTPEGNCDYLNERWLEYAGMPAGQLLGYGWVERLHPDDRESTMAAWRQSVRTGVPFDVVFRLRRSDGAYRWFKVRGTPLRDSAGRILKWFGANNDIDDLRRSEEALQQKGVLLEEANRELESFSYSVSHDLRAPLRQISGFSRILQEEFAPAFEPVVRHYFDRIEQGTRYMSELIDGLLGLSRISRQAMTFRPALLNSIVAEVIDGLQPECERRNVQWKIGALPSVPCDPSLIRVVFQNLLSNALKFTRSRNPAVIEVGHTGEPGQALIYVRDNGVGFDMRYACKLFGVFRRLHRSEDFEGAGIGLATVQRIIQRHGGRIWAEAEVDKGATFYFTAATEPRPQETNFVTGG